MLKKIKFNTAIAKEKKAGEKLVLPKPFEISNFKFYPVNYSESKKAGYKYFLLCKDLFDCVKCEKLSPRVKSKEEAEAFVYNNKNFSLKPV